MGWEDFLYELNKFVNRFVHGVPDENLENGLHYVTLNNRNDATGDAAELEVSLTKYDFDPHTTGIEEKRLSAIKYFLSEMGMNIDRITKSPDPRTPENVILHVSGLPRYEMPDYRHVRTSNPYMHRALTTGQMIDVRQIGTETEPGVYRLTRFVPDVEYVDSETGKYIYSIGRDHATGEILAALDGRFYNNPDYECVFLR